MKRSKEIKNLLGDRYHYDRLVSLREIRRLQRVTSAQLTPQTVAVLIAGCVKLEACLYPRNGKLLLGYDVLIKDAPDASEWICYDSPEDPVNLREAEMLAVLDRVVQENNLSYTECRFSHLSGKQSKPST